MATTDSELRQEIRTFGQYREEELSDHEIQTAISRAKQHLLNESTGIDSPDWYSNPLEEALFWTSMLFTKVITGALDAKAISVGDIDEDVLLAKSEDEITVWYRNYKTSKRNIGNGVANRITRTTRTTSEGERHYER